MQGAVRPLEPHNGAAAGAVRTVRGPLTPAPPARNSNMRPSQRHIDAVAAEYSSKCGRIIRTLTEAHCDDFETFRDNGQPRESRSDQQKI